MFYKFNNLWGAPKGIVSCEQLSKGFLMNFIKSQQNEIGELFRLQVTDFRPASFS